MSRSPARGSRVLALLAGLAFLVAACTPTLDQATGIVVAVDSPALGQVDGFELLSDGETLAFDTRELEFREAFPSAHIGEHMRLSEPIRVAYRRDGDRLVVTQLDDAGGGGLHDD